MNDLIRRDCTRTSPHDRHFWMLGEEYLSCPGSLPRGLTPQERADIDACDEDD